MKNSILILIASMVLSFFSIHSFAQSTSGNNNPGGTKFLGYNGPQDLDFRTNSIDRMRLMQTGTYTVDGYNIDNSGFLGLSIDPIFFGTSSQGGEPFSLLHLNGESNSVWGPQQLGYRDWMRPGITFTHNQDMMYIGPKRNALDKTDAVFSWSDNDQPGNNGPDVMRFIFTGRGNGSATVSTDPLLDTDYDGVECARIAGDAKMGVGPMWTNALMPKRALDVIRRDDELPQFRITHTASTSIDQGIQSDFQTSEIGVHYIYPRIDDRRRAVAIGSLYGNLSDPLDETWLDVGGQTRIRDLAEETPRSLIIGYQLDDANQSAEDEFLGRLDLQGDPCLVLGSDGTWVDICDLDGNDCRWVDMNSGTIGGEQDIRTGFDVNDPCYRGKVNIGSFISKEAKLEVWNNLTRDGLRTAGYFNSIAHQSNQSGSQVHGIRVVARGDNTSGQSFQANDYIGIQTDAGISRSGDYNVGIVSNAHSETYSTYGIGVYATAHGAAPGNDIGVYSEADIASYKVGGTITTGTTITISDESVKTDVNDIENATELLSLMQPKSYYMQNPENRDLHFDDAMQFGFIAQEMEEVLPDLVEQITIPEVRDTSGFVEGSSVELKGIKYQTLIPLLVAGFNEQTAVVGQQQGLIQDQNELIESLQATLVAQTAALETIQNQMEEVQSQVALMQVKTNNCCSNDDQGATMPKADTEGKELILGQNIPNPFSFMTRIDFELPQEAQIILEITDETGRPVERLIDGQMSNGAHSISWDGSRLAPGMYFYTLYANGELLTKKMIKN